MIHLPNDPSELGLPDDHDRVYDPLWAAFSETGILVHHHRDTTLPHSREVIERQCAGVAANEREQVLAGNARRFYGL